MQGNPSSEGSSGIAEPPKLRRAAVGERAFGFELVLSEKGAIGKAIAAFYGLAHAADKLAREQAERLARVLSECPTRKSRAHTAQLHFLLSAELRCHGRTMRATGPEVFFGAQHASEGPQRKYLPKLSPEGKHQQGGLAARLGVSVRTLYRYWSRLVLGEVWASCRPPRDARDAVLTRSGTQVYSQRWLVGGTPQAVRDRLPLRRETRRACKPDTAPAGRPMRVSEWREATAFLDGRDIPY